jgi:hypothetical protein
MNLGTGVIIAKVIHNSNVGSIDNVDFFRQNKGMARPRKEKGERKDADLRIPLTKSQKEMIVQVALSEGIDMATWARPILIQAAKQATAERRNRSQGDLGEGRIFPYSLGCHG